MTNPDLWDDLSLDPYDLADIKRATGYAAQQIDGELVNMLRAHRWLNAIVEAIGRQIEAQGPSDGVTYSQLRDLSQLHANPRVRELAETALAAQGNDVDVICAEISLVLQEEIR